MSGYRALSDEDLLDHIEKLLSELRADKLVFNQLKKSLPDAELMQVQKALKAKERALLAVLAEKLQRGL